MQTDHSLSQATVDFQIANLPLENPMSLGQFEILPLGKDHPLYPPLPGPGIHWTISARGRYRILPTRPLSASEVAREYIRQEDVLHLLLTFARGSYVPILGSRLTGRTIEGGTWKQDFTDASIVVPRASEEIYATEDQLTAFLRQTHSKVLSRDIGHSRRVRATLFYMSMAFDHEWVDIQYLTAWLALEILIAQPGTRQKIVSPASRFDRKVRSPIESALDTILPEVLGEIADKTELIKQAKAKVGELNRPPVVDRAKKFFDDLGQDIERRTLQSLAQRRHKIGHTGMARDPQPIDTVSAKLHQEYRDEMHEASWQLLNLLRSAILRMLVDKPLLDNLLERVRADGRSL